MSLALPFEAAYMAFYLRPMDIRQQAQSYNCAIIIDVTAEFQLSRLVCCSRLH